MRHKCISLWRTGVYNNAQHAASYKFSRVSLDLSQELHGSRTNLDIIRIIQFQSPCIWSVWPDFIQMAAVHDVSAYLTAGLLCPGGSYG